MCNYIYHHNPTCGHIASFNVDTCTAFTSSLRMADSDSDSDSDSDQQPTSCTKTVHSHDLVTPTSPSLCFQCEQKWMERAKKRVKAMALGKTPLDEYDEEQPDFVQLEGLDCPPKVGMTFTFSAPKDKEKKKLIGLGVAMDGGVQNDDDAETDIFIDAGVDYFISGDDNDETDYEDAHEHDTDDDGESCPTNSPSASQNSSFFEQRQYFDFYFDCENSPIPEEYVHVNAIDDESSDDDDIELVYLDYPNATPDHGKLLQDLDSSSDSFENVEYFDLSPTSSHPETSFLDLGDEENMALLSGSLHSPRTKEFKELEERVGDTAPSVTELLSRVYNGLPEILPKVTVMGRINRVLGR